MNTVYLSGKFEDIVKFDKRKLYIDILSTTEFLNSAKFRVNCQ